MSFFVNCMDNSETFKPVTAGLEYAQGYSMPEVFVTTSSAVLYRVRKAGKYFIIKTPKDGSGQSLAMLQREYGLSIGHQHPNVVNVFTYEESTVVGPGIVMEYVDGRTLADFIAENPAPAMRRRVFVQLLQAVAYIHRTGIVHNDIKPENILITRTDNDVRLIDFGLADDDAHYLARTLGCTPAYASPELLTREKDIDARSDIYSLGIIMRQLFGNRHSRMASRCLSPKREGRYANAEELLDAFKHRNRPVKIVAAVLLASVVLLPLLHYGLAGIQAGRKMAERDSLIARIESDVAAMYELTADSIKQAVYYEFATNNIVSFFGRLGEYQVKNISSVAEPELSSILSVHYMNIVNDCQQRLWQEAETLPSLYKSGLPPSAIIHYDSLVTRRLPFVPY